MIVNQWIVSFCASIYLGLMVVLFGFVAFDPNSRGDYGFYGFGVWAFLNTPSSITMGLGVLRNRRSRWLTSLLFMAVSGLCIELVVLQAFAADVLR